jgi:hypothetical protein
MRNGMRNLESEWEARIEINVGSPINKLPTSSLTTDKNCIFL